MDVKRKYQYLDPDRVEEMTVILHRRIGERFPEASLVQLCRQLVVVADEAKERAEWISKPIISVRIGTWSLVAVIIVGLCTTLASLKMPHSGFHLTEFIQVLEAGINDVVLIGAGVFFLLTLEVRVKRRRALAAIHELRSIAHIIDMHQITKDPQLLLGSSIATTSSPVRQMSAFELSRYLDYCSEMLSLVGKIAAIYVQNFDDSVALAAVNEVEELSTGLSRKVWQKLMILHNLRKEIGDGQFAFGAHVQGEGNSEPNSEGRNIQENKTQPGT